MAAANIQSRASKIDDAAKVLSKKYNIDYDEAKSLIEERLSVFSSEEKPIAKEPKKGFGENLSEYATDTVLHPLDRLSQIAIQSASTIPGMIDLASSAYHATKGEQRPQEFVAEDYQMPSGVGYDEERMPDEPLHLAQDTREFLTRHAKEKLGLNPAKNEFAERANEFPSALVDMVLNRGMGSGINKVAGAIKGASQKADVLGKTGKVIGEHIGKGVEKVGNFFKGGTNIRNPVEVGANLGAVTARNAIPDEYRNVFTDTVASIGGSLAGGGIPRKISQNTHEMRAFKAQNADKYKSNAYLKNKMYEDLGVPAYPFTLTESKPVKLGTKVMETSILGQNVRDALEKQKQGVSKAIYEGYDQPFSRSEIATMASPHIKKEAEAITEDFGKRFTQHRKDAAQYTDSQVKMKKVNEYMHNVLEGISDEPGHVKMFLASPLGQTLQEITGDTLGIALNQKLREYEKAVGKGGFNPREMKELEKIKGIIDSKPKKENVKINGVSVDIDPVIKNVLENPFLKKQLIIDNPYIKDSIAYLYADAVLQNIGEQGVFGKYFKKKDAGEMAGLYGALREDVNKSIIEPMSLKNKKAADQMRKNYSDYADFAQKERPDLNAMMQNVEDPLRLANMLVGDVQKSGNKKNLFARQMKPEDYERFVGKVNRMLGSANKANNADFNPAIWNKNFVAMDEIVKKNIYGKDLKRYESISKVIDDMQKVHKFENTSGSGLHTKSYAEGLTYAGSVVNAISNLFTGDWKIALASLTPILGVKGIDIGLTSPLAKRLIIKAQDAKKLNEAVDAITGLTKLSRSDKVRVMLKNLSKSLSLMEDKDERKRRRGEN